MGIEGFHNLPAVFDGKTLHGRREIESDDWRLILARKTGHCPQSHYGRASWRHLFLFAQELDGPGSDKFIGIRKEVEQMPGTERANGVSGPQGTKPDYPIPHLGPAQTILGQPLRRTVDSTSGGALLHESRRGQWS